MRVGGTTGWRIFRPAGLHLAVGLPLGWHEVAPEHANWKAAAPDHLTALYVTTVQASKPFAEVKPSFVALFRDRALNADPQAAVTSRSLHVSSTPAVEVKTRVDSFVDWTYGFEHRGLLYIVDFSTTTGAIARQTNNFERSVASIRLF